MTLSQDWLRRPTLMQLKQIFFATAAASCVLLAAGPGGIAVFSPVAKAQASVSVKVNFYDDLAPYGSWVSYENRYVWVPSNVSNDWRPYSEGHWAFTGRYGWIWVSDEKFGWATYHYGRWGHSADIGWYWVPGSQWAPAWVAWTYDGEDIAWAPLPPDRYEGTNFDTSFGFIPKNYWQGVPASALASENYSGQMFRNLDRINRVIDDSKIKSVRVVSNIVWNNAIDIGEIDKKADGKVVVPEAKQVDTADAASKSDGKFVAIFNPIVNEQPGLKPAKTKSLIEVTEERKATAKQAEKQTANLEASTTGSSTPTKNDDAAGASVAENVKGKPEIEKSEENLAVDDFVRVDKQASATASIDQNRSVVAPDKPLLPSETLNLETVDYDQAGNIVFGGRGPAGGKILLYIDNAAHGLVFISDKGTWNFAGRSPNTVGPHKLVAREIGGDGKMSSQLEMLFYREEPAKIANTLPPKDAPQAPKPQAVAKVQSTPTTAPKAEAKTEVTAKPETQVAANNLHVPADELTPPTKKKKQPNAKNKSKCDLAVDDCLAIKTLFNLKPQIKTMAKPKAKVIDVGAENWRVECSARFGGWSKASATYVSSSGKRVLCAFRPKNARG